MSNLISAEFHRLLHFKLYHIECALFVLFCLYTTLTDIAYPASIDNYMFQVIPFMGLASAVLVSQFIGKEYSCGTIRNKIFTEHSRAEIYFTELLLHFLADVNLLNISVLSVIISGFIHGRKYDFSFVVLLGGYFMCVCTIFLITALSVLVSILNSSNMSSLIILFLIWLSFTYAGADFNSKLYEPEIRMPYEFEIEEGQTEPVPNGLYVSGKMRNIHEILLLVNPYGQSAYEFDAIYDRYEEYQCSKIMEYPHLKILFYSLGESAILTAIGIATFKKKRIQ